MNALGVFRVGIFATLKMVKQLSLSNLQVTLNYLLFNIGKLFSRLDIVSFDICYNLPFSTPMKMRGPWR